MGNAEFSYGHIYGQPGRSPGETEFRPSFFIVLKAEQGKIRTVKKLYHYLNEQGATPPQEYGYRL